MTPDPEALQAALHRIDDELALLATWAGPAPGMAHQAAALVAYPAARLAGLRHWHDEPVLPPPHGEVLAMEASKWARLALKGHAGAIATMSAAPAYDPRGEAAALGAIARRCADGADGALVGQARFDVLNAWLETLRRRG